MAEGIKWLRIIVLTLLLLHYYNPSLKERGEERGEKDEREKSICSK